MKDILIFCPSIEYGGVEKNLYIISNYFARKIKKNRISIITANNNQKKNFSKKIKFYSPKKDFNNSSRLIKVIVSIILFLNNFRDKDIVILSFQANIAAILLAKIFKKKIIIRSNTAPEKFANNIFRKLFFGFFFKFADNIIVNSLIFKKQMKKFFNLNSICIYNSIKIKKIKKSKDNFFNDRYLKIITIGRLTDQKDHLTLLKALKLVIKKVNAKLMIVGKGNNLSILKNFVEENMLKKHVKFFGYTTNTDSLLKSSDLFILSSRYEGLPNVLIEAQSLNVPIISSDCQTGPKEILLYGKLGELFPVGNFKILSDKILSFSRNKKKYLNKSKLSKKFLFRFNIEKNCSKYLDTVRGF